MHSENIKKIGSVRRANHIQGFTSTISVHLRITPNPNRKSALQEYGSSVLLALQEVRVGNATDFSCLTRKKVQKSFRKNLSGYLSALLAPQKLPHRRKIFRFFVQPAVVSAFFQQYKTGIGQNFVGIFCGLHFDNIIFALYDKRGALKVP